MPNFRPRWSLVGSVLPLAACGSGTLCGNAVSQDIPSPGSTSRAVIFTRDCGATTGFSTQISVLGLQDALPNSEGNAFAADSNHGAAANMKVSVRWNSNDELVVSYSSQARVFDQESHARGVNVTYEQIP